MKILNRFLGIIAGVVLTFLSMASLAFVLPRVMAPGYSFSMESGIFIFGGMGIFFLAVAIILFLERPRNYRLHVFFASILAVCLVGAIIAIAGVFMKTSNPTQNILFPAYIALAVVALIPTMALFFRAYLLSRR